MRTRADNPPSTLRVRLRASCRLSYHVLFTSALSAYTSHAALKLCSVPRVQEDLHDPQREKAEKRAVPRTQERTPACSQSVSQLFHGPAPRSPLHRLAVRAASSVQGFPKAFLPRVSLDISSALQTMHMRLGSALISPALCPAHQSALPARLQLAHAASGASAMRLGPGAGGA